MRMGSHRYTLIYWIRRHQTYLVAEDVPHHTYLVAEDVPDAVAVAVAVSEAVEE